MQNKVLNICIRMMYTAKQMDGQKSLKVKTTTACLFEPEIQYFVRRVSCRKTENPSYVVLLFPYIDIGHYWGNIGGSSQHKVHFHNIVNLLKRRANKSFIVSLRHSQHD